MGSPLRPRVSGDESRLSGVEGLGVFRTDDRTQLHQLAVQVEHVARSCALVQVVDVLGHHAHVKAVLQAGYQFVSLVRGGLGKIVAARVIESVHKSGVCGKSLGRGDLHHRILLPQAAGVAECGYAAFGAYAGTCGKYYLFHDR